jgi:hypothetical protein
VLNLLLLIWFNLLNNRRRFSFIWIYISIPPSCLSLSSFPHFVVPQTVNIVSSFSKFHSLSFLSCIIFAALRWNSHTTRVPFYLHCKSSNFFSHVHIHDRYLEGDFVRMFFCYEYFSGISCKLSALCSALNHQILALRMLFELHKSVQQRKITQNPSKEPCTNFF